MHLRKRESVNNTKNIYNGFGSPLLLVLLSACLYSSSNGVTCIPDILLSILFYNLKLKKKCFMCFV